MKTSELIKKLKQYGETRKNEEYLEVWSVDDYKIVTVSLNEMLAFNMCYVEFSSLNQQQQSALFRIICDYATTPLNEREDEPKFRVHIWPGDHGYLNKRFGELKLNSKGDVFPFITVFTKAEYESLYKAYPEHIPYLPPFDENDPRFEMVEDGDEE